MTTQNKHHNKNKMNHEALKPSTLTDNMINKQ